jgi:hypothetical protein
MIACGFASPGSAGLVCRLGVGAATELRVSHSDYTFRCARRDHLTMRYEETARASCQVELRADTTVSHIYNSACIPHGGITGPTKSPEKHLLTIQTSQQAKVHLTVCRQERVPKRMLGLVAHRQSATETAQSTEISSFYNNWRLSCQRRLKQKQLQRIPSAPPTASASLNARYRRSLPKYQPCDVTPPPHFSANALRLAARC